MLFKSLSLNNFRCFEEVDIQFAPITLLTGANSSGKSTLINSILAMFQTEQFPFYLSPNGEFVNMGSFREMVFLNNVNHNISIDLVFKNQSHSGLNPDSSLNTKWEFNGVNSFPVLNSMSARFEELYFVNTHWNLDIYKLSQSSYKFELDLLMNDIRNDEVRSFLREIDGFNNSIQESEAHFDNRILVNKKFLSAEDFFKSVTHRKFIFNESFKRQFDGAFFNYIGSFRHPPERSNSRQSKAPNRVLKDGEGYLDQIIEWEETNPEKFQELNERIRKLELLESIGTNKINGGAAFDISVKIKEDSSKANLVDVGFGVSQFLPIIVADLQLPAESCLAISQPEIHLHPKIQAQFGNYLSDQIRQNGKQYIVETHSEYLLNRIRLLLAQGKLQPKDVKVYYFENDGIRSKTYEVEFTKDGQIKGAPDGFFDTYGIDVIDIAMSSVEE